MASLNFRTSIKWKVFTLEGIIKSPLFNKFPSSWQSRQVDNAEICFKTATPPSKIWCQIPPHLAVSCTVVTKFYIFFFDRVSSYNSGRWPNRCTISSVCLFESSTCFEPLCAHPQEDNCINTTSGIITVLCLVESSTCFEPLCAHPQEDNCINITSGIITVC
jgi:hypothetical protein